MGVRITSREDRVALFDSVSGFAFGPTFYSADEAQTFLEWFSGARGESADVRLLSDRKLEDAVSEWRNLEDASTSLDDVAEAVGKEYSDVLAVLGAGLAVRDDAAGLIRRLTRAGYEWRKTDGPQG